MKNKMNNQSKSKELFPQNDLQSSLPCLQFTNLQSILFLFLARIHNVP